MSKTLVIGAAGMIGRKLVKKLEGDNRDPSRYRARLAQWSELSRAGGANAFEVVVAPETLVAYLDRAR